MKAIKTILLSAVIFLFFNFHLYAQSDKFSEDLNAVQYAFNQGDAAESYRLINQFADNYPDSSKAWYFKSQIERQIIQYKKALESGQKAISIDPGVKAYYYQISLIYSDLHHYESCISYCDSVTHIDSTHLFAAILKGQALQKNGQIEEALDQYYSLHLRDSLNTNFMKRIGSLYAKMDSLNEAITWYSRVLKIDTADIQSYTNLGSYYVRTKQYDIGIPVMDRALAYDSINAWLYRFRGALNIMGANFEEAENDFTNSILCGDSSAFTFRHLGLSLYRQSKYEEALPVYQTTVKLDPEDSQAWYYLAFCNKWHEDIDQAIVCLDKALALSVTPGIADIYDGLAQFYALERKYDTAMHYYNRAYEWNPDDPVPLAQLGMLVEQTGGDKQYAKTLYQTFIEKARMEDFRLKRYVEERIERINEKLFMEGKLEKVN